MDYECILIIDNTPFAFWVAVILQIKGYAETHWADPEFDAEEDDLSSGELFNGHVDYMATKAYLYGSGSSIGECSKTINHHKFTDS